MFARARQRSVFVPRDGYILEMPKITFLIIIKIVQFACHAQLITNILWSTFMSLIYLFYLFIIMKFVKNSQVLCSLARD